MVFLIMHVALTPTSKKPEHKFQNECNPPLLAGVMITVHAVVMLLYLSDLFSLGHRCSHTESNL